MIIEMIQTTKAALPATPAIPPIEKSTRGGTPAATQNAPFQFRARTSSPELLSVTIVSATICPSAASALVSTGVPSVRVCPVLVLLGRGALYLCRMPAAPNPLAQNRTSPVLTFYASPPSSRPFLLAARAGPVLCRSCTGCRTKASCLCQANSGFATLLQAAFATKRFLPWGKIFFLAARFVARIRLKLRIFDAPKPERRLCESARYLISRSESGLPQLPYSEKSFSTVEWATLRC